MDNTIQTNLLPGEEILWEGQPQKSSSFNLGNLGASVFGIIWLAFSLFWTISAFLITRNTASGFFSLLFPLFGLPFVGVGVYIVFALPFKIRKLQNHTFYYVTNKRIIKNLDTASPVFNSIFIKDLKNVQLIKNRDYTGSITFGSFTFNSKTTSSDTSYAVPSYDNSFYRIESAEDVHQLILLHMQINDLKENS